MYLISSLTCLVSGNGAPLSPSEVPVDIWITFNGREAPRAVDWHLDVVSRRGTGIAGSQIEIIGKGPEDFVDRLRDAAHRTARKYEARLGCWPSTGFSIVHALWELDIAVQVHGIDFDPSLSQDGHVSPRSAPPVMYHNWLGERRFSFSRWLSAPPTTWHWPLMRPTTTPCPHSYDVLPSTDLLAMLLSARQSRRLEDLVYLLARPLRADPEYISTKASHIGALEQCFHLSRGVRETQNWWLYDEHAAAIIDQLAQRIRACQSALFAAALIHPTMPVG